eukprot:TRINITY_DN12753_c0_g1_i4.p1 TRINITY_DN12753_c0_g1~~TRINITY_DN12753_c0_g1_i4.p1  ORF type:complete len:1130 (-),score=367.41 TRINITY_DN12753_c0_g1_i4:470-3859(-)
MSDIILNWLNREVGLSKKVSAFERDFANGFLYAELLQRHNLLGGEELTTFADDASFGAKKKNFQQLASLLGRGGPAENLGIRLKDEQISEIMSEDRGSSLRLLFQLRKGLQQVKPVAPRSKGKALAPTTINWQKEVTKKHVRPLKGDEEERFFEQKMKPITFTDPRLRHELHTKKFVDEHTKQMRTAFEQETQQKEDMLARRSDFRQQRLDTMHESQRLKEEMRMDGEECGHATKLQMIAAVDRDLNFEKHTIRREIQKANKIRKRHEDDCGYAADDPSVPDHLLNGIAWFEKNLQRIGVDTSGEFGPTEPTIEASSLKEMHEKMTEQLPHPGEMEIESNKRLVKIKDAKKVYDRARKDRDNRQHRTMLDQQDMQAALGEKLEEADILKELLTETVEYRKEAMKWDLMERHKAAARVQLEERHATFASNFDQAAEDAYERIAAKAREDRAQQLADKASEAERARMRMAAGVQAADMTSSPGATGEAADSSDEDDVGPLRQLREDQLNDDRLLRSLKPQKGDTEDNMPQASQAAVDTQDDQLASTRLGRNTALSILRDEDAAATLPNLQQQHMAQVQPLLDCVEDQLVSSYVFSRGKWQPWLPSSAEVNAFVRQTSGEAAASSSSAPRPKLGCLVRWLNAPSQPEAQEASLPADFPIIALGGHPAGLGASGVGMAVAKRIAKENEFVVVEARKASAESCALARKDGPEPEYPMLSRMHKLGQNMVKEQGEDGQVAAVGASSYLEALFRRIELASAPAPKEEEEDPKAKAKSKAKAKAKGKAKGAEEEPAEPEKPKGVVIVGFPSDMHQQAAWEMALRGYISPLLRLQDGSQDLQAQLSAVLAPWVPQHETRSSRSGYRPDALPAVGSELPILKLRLKHASHAALCDAVVAEASKSGAWQAPAHVTLQAEEEAAAAEGAAANKDLGYCAGYEREISQTVNPADRAWLFQQSQYVLEDFLRPVGGCAEVEAAAAPAAADADAGDSTEEACYKQAMEKVSAWQNKREASKREASKRKASKRGASKEGEDHADRAADAAEEDPEGNRIAEDAADEDADGDDEDQELMKDPSAGPGPWRTLPGEKRAHLQEAWLEALSSYLLLVKDVLADVEEMEEPEVGFCEEQMWGQPMFRCP